MEFLCTSKAAGIENTSGECYIYKCWPKNEKLTKLFISTN
ncbi:unnamed protein product [Brassica oleracea]